MKLTPTQELFMEVLAARYRLGEQIWTFASNAASWRAATGLKQLGLIYTLGGQVESTFRASLTEAGKKERQLDLDYVPPIMRERQRKITVCLDSKPVIEVNVL